MTLFKELSELCLAKAVSNIIAILILIAIVLSAAVVFHYFVVNYTQGPSKPKGMGVLPIDAYAITCGGGLVIYARNVEDYTMHVDTYYLLSGGGLPNDIKIGKPVG